MFATLIAPSTTAQETSWKSKPPQARTWFFLGLILTATGLISAPFALALGILFGFTQEHPLRKESSALARTLLQLSVIGLGFGMNLATVLHAGRSGFFYTAISITLAMALGLLLGKTLNVTGKASFLVTAGTAICGGSAIAALAPITEPNEEQISVSSKSCSAATRKFSVAATVRKTRSRKFSMGNSLVETRTL